MAFSGPSSTSAKVKPVPPPKPLSPSAPSPLKSEAYNGQKGERRWERPGTFTSVADSQSVKLQRELNLNPEDGSGSQLENNQKGPTSRLITPSKANPLWKISQEEKVAVTGKPVPIGASSPSSQFSAKCLGPASSARDDARPPLLPKPSSIAARNLSKPPVPKRPDATLLVRRTLHESSTQTPPCGKVAGIKKEPLGKLNISRSSVTNLEHFENVGKDGCGSPVRPPRSPKNKPCTGMPFSYLITKNLSPNQKILSLPHGERQKSFLWSLRECETNSLGCRDETCRLAEVRAKSCSLERNESLNSSEHAPFRHRIRFKDPIPPPRRVKKKSPTETEHVPEYAAVNYELKKNRRLQGISGVGGNFAISSHNSSAEGELSPSTDTVNQVSESAASEKVGGSCGSQSESCGAAVEEGVKCKGCDLYVRVAQTLPRVLDEEHGDYYTKCVVHGGEDSKSASEDVKCSYEEVVSVPIKSPGTVVTSEATEINSKQLKSDSDICELGESEAKVADAIVSSVVKDFPDGKSDILASGILELEEKQHLWQDIDSPMLKDITSPTLSFEGSIKSSREANAEIPSLSSDNIGVIDSTKSLETKFDEEQITNCDNVVFYKVENIKSVDVENIDIGDSELDHSSKSTLVVTVEQNSLSSEVLPLPRELSSNGKGNLRKTSSDSDCSPWADALESKRSDDDEVEFKRIENSTLPLRSRLNASHGGSNDDNRRQSWSDGQKKESGSSGWSGAGKQRRKRRGQSLWCDEGDLSSGTLGDQSSFEDVPMDGKSGETSIVRRRLSALFSSFGKNSRKSRVIGHKQKEKKLRGNTRFHHEIDDEGSHLKVEKPAIEALNPDANSEILHSVCSIDEEVKAMEDTQETSEDIGVPRLCMKMGSLDMKRQSGEFGSGSHISEQSFDNVHSESENEEMLLPEEKLDRTLSEKERKEKKRFYIAQELMSSERVFVDALRLLCIDFCTAVSNAGMEQKTEIISEADLCKILHNLPQLLRFNEELLQDLEDRISSWNHSQKIADIIVRKGPFLKLYTSYFQNFETQCQYLDECCDSNARFARVVRDFEASPRCQRLALKHFMLKPIQRLPQYRLLLEDYLAKLEPESTDYEDTKVALGIVCDVADHANRSMKQGDALSKLLQLQSLLKNYAIIKPGRTFLKEGELQKLCRKGMLNRYFILLNDCLLYASYDRSVQAAGSLKVNNELPLDGMKVEIPVAEDYTNEFSIISITRSFTLSASSAQERVEWVNALQKAIHDYTLRQQTFLQMKLAQSNANQKAPVWIQDCRVTMCQSCTSEFTVTFRRHHCRACGKVVCGKCSANRAPLQYMKFQAARVCDECFESLLRDFEKSTQEAFEREFGLAGATYGNIRASFKKLGQPAAGKKIKYVPQRLKEVCANDTGSQMSGWLQYRCRKSWKKMWFVLKDQVLYVYKASEDVVALESIPILGYQVLIPCEVENVKQEESENGLAFSLTHKGKQYLEFQADNIHSSKRWITAMQEATVLK
ncbi:uncharacterized protein [Hetaerina americana]|uniref:uncharacterized protein isoform X2 n=1 Tax=Hetaerina americana TaxID=62018 RepID=UPI003A7F38F4